jgi:hypothetical protein
LKSKSARKKFLEQRGCATTRFARERGASLCWDRSHLLGKAKRKKLSAQKIPREK